MKQNRRRNHETRLIQLEERMQSPQTHRSLDLLSIGNDNKHVGESVSERCEVLLCESSVSKEKEAKKARRSGFLVLLIDQDFLLLFVAAIDS